MSVIYEYLVFLKIHNPVMVIVRGKKTRGHADSRRLAGRRRHRLLSELHVNV